MRGKIFTRLVRSAPSKCEYANCQSSELFGREFRQLFQRVRELVVLRYPESSKDLPLQAVNALCFLRYFVPAILHPQLHGLYSGKPSLLP
jgi:hypothetical protein